MGSDLLNGDGFYTYDADGRRVIDQIRRDALDYFANREMVGVGPQMRLLRRRPSVVQSMQVLVGYEKHVADWCGGFPIYGHGVVVWSPSGDLVHAAYGDWVVHDEFGHYSPVSDRDIFREYESVIPAVAE